MDGRTGADGRRRHRPSGRRRSVAACRRSSSRSYELEQERHAVPRQVVGRTELPLIKFEMEGSSGDR
eukprot:scaffold102409_cov60-Phaeocystis_antarctica.AAC.1